jgi:uncharacterized DUF497 family protein
VQWFRGLTAVFHPHFDTKTYIRYRMYECVLSGMSVLLVLVAYSVIDDKDEVLCIISARRVTRQERIEYEEANEI